MPRGFTNLMKKIKINDIIIVEGKDDVTRVRECVDGVVISTGGVHISPEKREEIKSITHNRDVIIFTDPDHAGEKIRSSIKKILNRDVKEAYISRKKCDLKGDIGVENADCEDIIDALKKAHASTGENKRIYDEAFLFKNNLSGSSNSKKRREIFCDKLNLGRPTSKQLLNRLNTFSIPEEIVEKVLKEIDIDG